MASIPTMVGHRLAGCKRVVRHMVILQHHSRAPFLFLGHPVLCTDVFTEKCVQRKKKKQGSTVLYTVIFSDLNGCSKAVACIAEAAQSLLHAAMFQQHVSDHCCKKGLMRGISCSETPDGSQIYCQLSLCAMHHIHLQGRPAKSVLHHINRMFSPVPLVFLQPLMRARR